MRDELLKLAQELRRQAVRDNVDRMVKAAHILRAAKGLSVLQQKIARTEKGN